MNNEENKIFYQVEITKSGKVMIELFACQIHGCSSGNVDLSVFHHFEGYWIDPGLAACWYAKTRVIGKW